MMLGTSVFKNHSEKSHSATWRAKRAYFNSKVKYLKFGAKIERKQQTEKGGKIQIFEKSEENMYDSVC